MNRSQSGRSPTLAWLGAVLLPLLSMSARAAQPVVPGNMGLVAFDGTDLNPLLHEAELRGGLSSEDAVVLLERSVITWTVDGRRDELLHRVVHLATDFAVEHYADLRIPYDSLRTEMTVLALRTWRDGAWIESGPTGQVETLPYALADAPDYCAWRERMLLHDGVERPCLVETAWRVTDRAPFRDGIEGVWIFPQADPCIRSEFSLTAPREDHVHVASSLGAPAPQVEEVAPGSVRISVRMDRLAPADLGGVDPASYLPHVRWSSWTDWSSLGTDLLRRFSVAVIEPVGNRAVTPEGSVGEGGGPSGRAASSGANESRGSSGTQGSSVTPGSPATGDDFVAREDTTEAGRMAAADSLFDRALASIGLRDTLRARLDETPSRLEVARRVAALVSSSTRSIEGSVPWTAVDLRPADRTWVTAYGHDSDRVILAAALYRAAGFAVWPLYVSAGWAPLDGTTPTLAAMRPLQLLIAVRSKGAGADLSPSPGSVAALLEGAGHGAREGKNAGTTIWLGTFSSESAEFRPGVAHLIGRTVWIPGAFDQPRRFPEAWPDRESDGNPGPLRLPSLPPSAAGEIPDTSRLTVSLDLRWNAPESTWTGTGTIAASGTLSSYASLAGIGDEPGGWIDALCAGLLPGAEVTRHGVSMLEPWRTEAGFSFRLAAGTPDDLGRIRLEIGDPPEGILDRIPGAVHLHEERRRAPIDLPGPLRQVVQVTLRGVEDRLVRVPEEMLLETAAGRAAVRVRRTEDRLVLSRELRVGGVTASTARAGAGGARAPGESTSPSVGRGASGAGDGSAERVNWLRIGAEHWRDLRSLLLLERGAAGRTILLRSDSKS